jgi:hypothetical protein
MIFLLFIITDTLLCLMYNAENYPRGEDSWNCIIVAHHKLHFIGSSSIPLTEYFYTEYSALRNEKEKKKRHHPLRIKTVSTNGFNHAIQYSLSPI